VIDALYVFNHIVDREIGKKKGKVFACFVDLKATFDKVDRDILKERMKKMGISNRLRNRIMDIEKRERW